MHSHARLCLYLNASLYLLLSLLLPSWIPAHLIVYLSTRVSLDSPSSSCHKDTQNLSALSPKIPFRTEWTQIYGSEGWKSLYF